MLLREKINVMKELKQGQEKIKETIGFYPFNAEYNQNLEEDFNRKVKAFIN